MAKPKQDAVLLPGQERRRVSEEQKQTHTHTPQQSSHPSVLEAVSLAMTCLP